MLSFSPLTERLYSIVRVFSLSILGGLPTHASLTNRWSFNNAAGAAPAGTAMPDSVSSVIATVRGNGSTFTGTGLTITGATNGNRSGGFISGYVDLPNGIISSKTHLSVEVWATPISAKAYARVFEFGRVTGAGYGGGAPGELIDVTGTGMVPGTTAGFDSVELTWFEPRTSVTF